MNEGQTRGMIAITIAFAIAVIGGITLSFLTVDRLSATQTVTSAFMVFLCTVPFFGYGIFTYAKATQDEAVMTNDDMEKPRQLLDILREQGQMDVGELAKQLDVTSQDVRHYINDLGRLGLFTGIADWDNDVIAIVDPTVVNILEQCKSCGSPIQINGSMTRCRVCGTEYYTLSP